MNEMESLGKYLRNERESRGISLREISKKIRVREPFLKAVEEDRHDLLPSPTYVKGFLSAYARYLGLDPNEVIVRYESFLKGEPIPPPEVPPKKMISWKERTIWIVGGVIFVILIAFYFLLFSPPRPTMEPISPKPEVKEAPPAETPGPIPGKPSVPEEKPITLYLKAVERTWISLQVDGESEQDIMLQPGEAISYRAMQRIQMIVGNAGGLEVIFNEKRLEKFGKSGEVFNLIFTPQGVEASPREKPEPPEG